MKKTITLQAMDPIEIFGAGNKILDAFCGYFPDLKVAARGDEIHLEGDESRIQEFNQRFSELVQRRHRKMNLTVFDVEDLFDGTGQDGTIRLSPESTIVHGTDGKPIKARNKTQQEMVKAYFENDLIFAVGPAGTGKTYVAIALAVRALKNREIKRIILTRPAVEAGERLGFLPGDLQSKVDPYLRPLYDALFDMLGADTYQKYLERGNIEVAPLAYMRGRTLDDSFIILDEAQNTSREQMKMFLTRIGFGSKVVITGDITQIDLPEDKVSGLKIAMKVLDGIEDIAVCTLSGSDVVRHRLVQKIIEAYEDFDRKNPEKTAVKKLPSKKYRRG